MGSNDLFSETHAKHTEMSKGANRQDLLCLIAEGKHPASQEENERAIGEDGKPLEKLQLVPERDILRGGMPNWWWKRSDQASTSKGLRAKDLHRMPLGKQVIWCQRDENIAEAFGPDGNQALRPVIMNLLKHPGIPTVDRVKIAGKIVAKRPGVETLLQVLKDVYVHVASTHYSSVHEDVRQVVLAEKPEPEFIPDMLQIIQNRKICSNMRIDLCTAILAAKPGPEFFPAILHMVNKMSKHLDPFEKKRITNYIIMEEAEHKLNKMKRTLTTAPITSSNEASSSRSAGEARSSQQREGRRQEVRSGEDSRQRKQLSARTRTILAQMKEREKKLTEEAEQRLQRELRTQAETIRQDEQQKLPSQLTQVQQDLDRFESQFTQVQQERDQALRQLVEMKPSSRAEMRANDTLPTTSEGLLEQLEREQRTSKEQTFQELTSQLEQRTQERNNLENTKRELSSKLKQALREKANLAQQLEQALREKEALTQQLERSRLGGTSSLQKGEMSSPLIN